MAANSSVVLTSLDHDTLKASLRDFMRSQDVLRDYDFDGSTIGVLIDELAYNTTLNAFYLNMVATEGWLESAQLRDSVVSRVKELNYLPRSARSASARLRVTISANATTLVMPKGTSFTGRYGSGSFVFTTDVTRTVNSSNGTFVFDDVTVYEGAYVRDSFVYRRSAEDKRFVLTNPSIDTSSVVVNVVEDGGATVTTHSLATSLLGLNQSSRVYFMQGARGGRYEILFGDGIVGREPADGAVIVVEYRVTRGAAADGVTVFTLNDDIAGGLGSGAPRVETLSIASNGAAPESLESIRRIAPRWFQAQERAVTVTDYETILRARFPEINAVSAFGGEQLDPPRHGRVYIAVDVAGIDGLPESKRSEYTDFMAGRAAMPVVFVEPEYLYYRVETTVNYNVNLTTLGQDDIRTLVETAINSYNSANLDDFKSTLRYSRLVGAIDDAHTSIVSNETSVRVYKKLNPTLGVPQNIVVDLGVPLLSTVPRLGDSYPITEIRTIRSSPFVYNGDRVSLEDDGDGTVRIVKLVGATNTRVVDVGTVDYDAGIVRLTGFKPDAYDGSSLRIYAETRDHDFSSRRNTVLTLEPSEVVVTVRPVRE